MEHFFQSCLQSQKSKTNHALLQETAIQTFIHRQYRVDNCMVLHMPDIETGCHSEESESWITMWCDRLKEPVASVWTHSLDISSALN